MKMYNQIAPMQKTHKNKLQHCPFIVHLLVYFKSYYRKYHQTPT